MVAAKSNLCESCKATGMTFIPVRYAPVPARVKPALPAWAHSEKVTKINLGADYHYALRTIREGYFYLFYPKGMRGSNYWEAYTVYTDGSLARQLTPKSAEAPKAAPACVKHGADNTGLHYIVIQQPDKCDTVYIAYSEHKWSDDTLKQYATNTAKREARMQTIKPSAMVNSAASSHGTLATKDSIEAILDYNSSFTPEHLPDISTPLRSFTKLDGSYDIRAVMRNSTMYPWSKRKGQADHLIKNMQKRSVKKDGSPAGIHVIAVWDAIGTVHELNGFRNEPAGRLKQYGQERDFELTGLNAIEGVKKALADKAGKLADAESSYIPGFKAGSLDHYSDLARRRTNARMDFRDNKNKAALDKELYSIEQERIKRDAPAEEASQRNKNSEAGQHYKDLAMKRSWSRYEDKLNVTAFNTFKTNYDKLLTDTDGLIDRRTVVLIKWLEASLFMETLEDFHSSNIHDGVLFDDVVGGAIFGLNSSKAGAKKIDEWVKGAKNVKSNLLWRTLAMNQADILKDIDTAMTAAASKQAPIGGLTVDFLTVHVRKWADIYKKANTMQNTWAKAQNATEGIKLVKVTNIDRLFMTVGDRLFKPFLQHKVDHASEYAVRGLMLARAGVEPDRIMDAIKVQAKQEGLARSAIVNRLRVAKTFIGSGKDFKDAKFIELEGKWKSVKADQVKGATALKENRLSLLVAVLEIINLTKIAWEFKDNQKTFGELAAAASTAIAALSDVAANAAKHLVGDKVSATFQYLKVFGGVLSAGAGYYVMVQEWDKAEKLKSEENYGLATASYLKVVTQFGSATFGLLGSLSYAAPLLEASGIKAGQWVGKRLLFYRLFCMTWAIRLNIVGLVITFFVWKFTPNALENWCEKSPFGLKRDAGSKDSIQQMNQLTSALQEVL